MTVTQEQIVAALTQHISDVPEHARHGKGGDFHYPNVPWFSAFVAECCGCSWPDQPELVADVILDYLERTAHEQPPS